MIDDSLALTFAVVILGLGVVAFIGIVFFSFTILGRIMRPKDVTRESHRKY